MIKIRIRKLSRKQKKRQNHRLIDDFRSFFTTALHSIKSWVILLSFKFFFIWIIKDSKKTYQIISYLETKPFTLNVTLNKYNYYHKMKCSKSDYIKIRNTYDNDMHIACYPNLYLSYLSSHLFCVNTFPLNLSDLNESLNYLKNH